MTPDPPAVVLLAHDKPRHLRRLVEALAPLPVFLHIDATVLRTQYDELTRDLPERVVLLPRIAAGWGQFELVEAEISGYRAALAATTAEHLIMMSGADYPLLRTSDLIDELAKYPGVSLAQVDPFPVADWGPMGGYDRIWFRQRPWKRRRMVLPLPRRVPSELDPAAGSQMKILSRADAELVVSVMDDRPDLISFFRTCWIPDELMVPTILNSPRLVDRTVRVQRPARWVIDWGAGRNQSPRTLTVDDLPKLREESARAESPALFARKFADDSDDLVDLINDELRTVF